MEKVTEERLVKAGWDEKRTIDISNIKDVYQKLGLVMPMNVEKFGVYPRKSTGMQFG